jgi:hypothetical protein
MFVLVLGGFLTNLYGAVFVLRVHAVFRRIGAVDQILDGLIGLHMFESLRTRPDEEFPSLRQSGLIASWGALLALGGCGTYVATLSWHSSSPLRFASMVFAAIFVVGAIGILIALILYLIAAIQGIASYFKE